MNPVKRQPRARKPLSNMLDLLPADRRIATTRRRKSNPAPASASETHGADNAAAVPPPKTPTPDSR